MISLVFATLLITKGAVLSASLKPYAAVLKYSFGVLHHCTMCSFIGQIQSVKIEADVVNQERDISMKLIAFSRELTENRQENSKREKNSKETYRKIKKK